MTLAIAYRSRFKIALWSDSRISWADGGFTDYGIKIFSIPAKVKYINNKNEQSKIIYVNDLGMVVIGSTFNTYTIKEYIAEFLKESIYSSTEGLSMDIIADAVFKVFKVVSLEIIGVLKEKAFCQIVIVGICPKEKITRFYCYEIDNNEIPVKPRYSEILREYGMEFFGSGKKAAELVKKEGNFDHPLWILREVIRRKMVDGVGGQIQLGEFDDSNFEVLAATFTESDGVISTVYTSRGEFLHKEIYNVEEEDKRY